MKPLSDWTAAELRRDLHSHNSGEGGRFDALLDELLRRERKQALGEAARMAMGKAMDYLEGYARQDFAALSRDIRAAV